MRSWQVNERIKFMNSLKILLFCLQNSCKLDTQWSKWRTALETWNTKPKIKSLLKWGERNSFHTKIEITWNFKFSFLLVMRLNDEIYVPKQPNRHRCCHAGKRNHLLTTEYCIEMMSSLVEFILIQFAKPNFTLLWFNSKKCFQKENVRKMEKFSTLASAFWGDLN